MNIRGIARLLGDVEFASLRNGEAVVDKINQLFPDDQKINLTSTGQQLLSQYNALPAVVKHEVDAVSIVGLAESIAMTSDVRKAARTVDERPMGRGWIVIALAGVLTIVAVMLVFAYVLISIKNGQVPESDILENTMNALGEILKAYLGS